MSRGNRGRPAPHPQLLRLSGKPRLTAVDAIASALVGNPWQPVTQPAIPVAREARLRPGTRSLATRHADRNAAAASWNRRTICATAVSAHIALYGLPVNPVLVTIAAEVISCLAGVPGPGSA